jgi:putative transposase
VYLVAIMDWFSRYVVAWALSNSLDGSFCRTALQLALTHGTPVIFNADQGSQFTGQSEPGLSDAGRDALRDVEDFTYFGHFVV